MELQQVKDTYLNMVIDSLRFAIGTLQVSLLKSADQLDNLSPETAELKALAVSLARDINPASLFLEQLKIGLTPKALIFIDDQGIAHDLITGKPLSGQQCINQILDNVKVSKNE